MATEHHEWWSDPAWPHPRRYPFHAKWDHKRNNHESSAKKDPALRIRLEADDRTGDERLEQTARNNILGQNEPDDFAGHPGRPAPSQSGEKQGYPGETRRARNLKSDYDNEQQTRKRAVSGELNLLVQSRNNDPKWREIRLQGLEGRFEGDALGHRALHAALDLILEQAASGNAFQGRAKDSASNLHEIHVRLQVIATSSHIRRHLRRYTDDGIIDGTTQGNIYRIVLGLCFPVFPAGYNTLNKPGCLAGQLAYGPCDSNPAHELDISVFVSQAVHESSTHSGQGQGKRHSDAERDKGSVAQDFNYYSFHNRQRYQTAYKIGTILTVMNRNHALFSNRATNAEKSIERTLALIADSDEPGAIVKELAPHDLLVAWRLADDEQRTDLLRLADKEQASCFFDLHCWSSYLPDLDDLETTVRPLVLSGTGGALYVLDILDAELRTLLLKRNVRVHLLENRNDEIPTTEGSEVIPCPDGSYFLELLDPDSISDVQRALLNVLLIRPFEQYQTEIECMRHDFPSELEETALRWRSGRLADLGFSSQEDAMALLVPRSVKEARRLAERSEKKFGSGILNIALPMLYRENLSGNHFLDRVLAILAASTIPEIERNTANLGAELSAMISSFLAAAGFDISDLDEVAQGAARARDILSLGLAETAESDLERGAHLLVELPPSIFIQVGLGLVYPLRDRARKLLLDSRFASSSRPEAIFDPPHHVTLTCLAQDIPCRWPMLEEGDNPWIDPVVPRKKELAAFSRLGEIAAADRILTEAELLGSFLFDTLGCEMPPPEETPASILVLTALANAANGHDTRPVPVTAEEAGLFKEQALLMEPGLFATDALAALLNTSPALENDTASPDEEPDPLLRLVLRLVLLGRARLGAQTLEQAVLIEPI